MSQVSVPMMLMLTVGFASGCESVSAVNFKKAPSSGIETKQHVRLIRMGGGTDDFQKRPFRIVGNTLAAKALKHSVAQCYATGAVPLWAIPIAISTGRYVFGLLLDAGAKEAKKLQDRAQRIYDEKILIQGRVFAGEDVQECLLLVRYGKEIVDENKPDIVKIDDIGLAVLFRKTPLGNGLTFQLYFLWLANAVAITDKESSKINLSLAVVAKGYDKSNSGFRARSLGESSLSIEAVPIQPDRPQLDCGYYEPAEQPKEPYTAVCDDSRVLEPFDMPHQDARGGLISVAVTETGSPAKAADKAKAEAEALKKAFGPAVGKAIETLLTPSEK